MRGKALALRPPVIQDGARVDTHAPVEPDRQRAIEPNPNYEKVTDTVATLNLAFHAEVTRGLVATLATFANP